MTRACEAHGGINLGQGLCDMPTHPAVRAGAIEAIEARRNTYSYAEGAVELRAALARKLARDNGLEVDPASELVITVGSTGAFTCAVTALLDPGDGLLLLEPYYGYHLNAARLAGLDVQLAALAPPRFALTREVLEGALRPHTKAVVACTPSNPSGKMMTRAELEVLAAVAEERDLLVLTDEIYEYIRFDGTPHVSPASLPSLRARTVTIGGASKTFSITGWRIGWAAAAEPLARAVSLVNDMYYVCAPTPLQLGVARGFDAPGPYFDDLAQTYQKKRDLVCDALAAAGMPPIRPQGAYYVLADISGLGFATAKDAAMQLLERAKVAAIPGTAFFRGDTGERTLRFCFAKEDDVLREAADRIAGFRAQP